MMGLVEETCLAGAVVKHALDCASYVINADFTMV